MRSDAPLSGCSSPGVICSNGRPRRRRRSGNGLILLASIAGWLPRSFVAGVVLLVSLLAGEGTWPLVLPFAALWAASPAFACWISQSPPVAGRMPMSDRRCNGASAERRAGRGDSSKRSSRLPTTCCRRTIFRKIRRLLAHRTSPTNIGLYLLSTASARDFGWIGTTEAVERLEVDAVDHEQAFEVSWAFLQLV